MCHMSRVMCHVVRVTCQMLNVTCHIKKKYLNYIYIFFFYKLVNLFGEGPVINGPTLSSFCNKRAGNAIRLNIPQMELEKKGTPDVEDTYRLVSFKYFFVYFI